MKLTDIWPTLGIAVGQPRFGPQGNQSHTKKGPGRRHLQCKPKKTVAIGDTTQAANKVAF